MLSTITTNEYFQMNNELLHKYFKGDATLEEEKIILDWVESSEENQKTLQKERMFFDISLFSENKVEKSRTTKIRIKPIINWGVRIAAAIILIIGSKSLFEEYQYDKNSQTQTITVPAGQRAQIVLADGTKVWLNSKSTLKYAANFGKNERNVQLNGEAYFEVTPNKKVPFFVNTETNQIKVVGTHFNVCAYDGTNEFETTLLEGIVDIYASGSDHPIARLQKNEFFSAHNGQYTKNILPSYEFLRWKEGLYCFDDTPFGILLKKLEKYYNITVTVKNPQRLDYRCTGKFKEQDGIEHILRTIRKDHKFTYHINAEKDSIIIE